MGSRNVGALNTYQQVGAWAGLTVLLVDTAKGVLAVTVPRLVGVDDWALFITTPLMVAGHNWPVFLGFRGGKGAATALGVLAAIAWEVALLAALTWLAIALIFRYASLASMVSLAAAPFYAVWLADPQRTELAGFMAILVILRHHANIRRLIKGEEPKIGRSAAEK